MMYSTPASEDRATAYSQDTYGTDSEVQWTLALKE